MSKTDEMITVTKLPTWIKNSPFIKEFEADYPDEPYVLPKSKYYKYPKKLTAKNIIAVLNIVRYYGIDDDDIMYDIFVFFFDINNLKQYVSNRIPKHPTLNLNDIISEFPEFKEIWRNATVDRSSDEASFRLFDITKNFKPTLYAARNRMFYLIKFLLLSGEYDKPNNYSDETYLAEQCAQYGDLKSLMFVHEHGYKMSYKTCLHAAKYGKLECLKYAYFNTDKSKNTYDLINTALHTVLERGNIECVKFLISQKVPMDIMTCSYAIWGSLKRSDSLEYLKLVHMAGAPKDYRALRDAETNEQIEYLREHNFPEA